MKERLSNSQAQGTPLRLSMSTALYIGKSNCGHRQSRCLSVSCPRILQIIHSQENMNQNCKHILFAVMLESSIPYIVLNSFPFSLYSMYASMLSLLLVHRSRHFCWPKKFKNQESCYHFVHFWPDINERGCKYLSVLYFCHRIATVSTYQ